MFAIIIKETALGKTIIANMTSVGSFVHELMLDFLPLNPRKNKVEELQTDHQKPRQLTCLSHFGSVQAARYL